MKTRILVPVDYSECSAAALRFALHVGAEHDADVDVLHVCSGAELVSTSAGFGQPFDEVEDDVRGDELEKLEAFVSSVSLVRERVSTRVVFGPTVDVVVAVSESGGYDMVILGVRGTSGLHKLIFGSVARGVVEHAKCSVMAVKEGDKPPRWFVHPRLTDDDGTS